MTCNLIRGYNLLTGVSRYGIASHISSRSFGMEIVITVKPASRHFRTGSGGLPPNCPWQRGDRCVREGLRGALAARFRVDERGLQQRGSKRQGSRDTTELQIPLLQTSLRKARIGGMASSMQSRICIYTFCMWFEYADARADVGHYQ